MGADGRRAVLGLVRSRLPEIGAAAVAAVRRSVPAYRDLREDQVRDVSAIASWAVVRFLELWVDDARLDAADLARFRSIGASRAEDGRPLAAVLRSYRVAAARAADAVLDLGRAHLDVDDVRVLVAAVLAFTDDVSEAITAGWTGSRDRLTADRGRARRELLDDLLVGRQTSAGALESRSRELGLALPARVALLVAEAPDATRAVERGPGTRGGPERPAGRAAGPRDGTPDGPGRGAVPPHRAVAPYRPVDPPAVEALCADLGLPADGPQHLATVRGRRAVLLVAVPVALRAEGAVAARGWRGCVVRDRAVDEVDAAFRLAADALDAAPHHAFARRRVLDDGDAAALALLGARAGAAPEQVVAAVLGRLADAPHLLDGLGAYLAGGSATDAAQRLGLHPQTLRYRLRRAAALTGRDPRDPWDRFVLQVAHHAALTG